MIKIRPFLALYFALCLTLAFAPATARAGSPVKAVLYEYDAKAPDGFKAAYRWQMNPGDEWRRFEYQMTKAAAGKKESIDPTIATPRHMIVLSVKDTNGITGRDYYISPNGVMINYISARNAYYADTNKFYSFLKEEVLNHSSFEKFSGETINPETPGVIVHYNINESMPNPVWLVNNQKDVNLYDYFLRKARPLDKYGVKQFKMNDSYDKLGTFVIMLNYPKAPARYATVTDRIMLLSTNFNETKYFIDPKKYFDFFYNLAKDSQQTSREVKSKDRKLEERGQF